VASGRRFNRPTADLTTEYGGASVGRDGLSHKRAAFSTRHAVRPSTVRHEIPTHVRGRAAQRRDTAKRFREVFHAGRDRYVCAVPPCRRRCIANAREVFAERIKRNKGRSHVNGQRGDSGQGLRRGMGLDWPKRPGERRRQYCPSRPGRAAFGKEGYPIALWRGRAQRRGHLSTTPAIEALMGRDASNRSVRSN